MKHPDGREISTSLSAPDAKEAARIKTFPSFLRWPLFWFFILFSLAVSAVSYAAFLRYSSDTRQEEMKLLATIADQKVDEIIRWRKEREGDAEVFSRSPFFVRAFEKWLQQGAPHDENWQTLIERMKLTQRVYGYKEIILFDARSKPVLSTNPDAPLPAARAMELVKQAIQTQNLIALDISLSDVADSMDVIVPISGRHGDQDIGVAYLRVDAPRFFFPLLKAMPSNHESMELVLARREGDDVLLLNIPAANVAGKLLRQPLGKSNLPAAMAASGMHGEVEGVDYRGVPVFAALRKIPGSDWALVTKVNQEEVYAPLRNTALLLAGAIAFLIALTGVAVGLWWRNLRAQFLFAEQEQTEKNLRNESAYTRSLIDASLDPLVTISTDGKIIDANKATEEATGISRSQLIGTDFASYFTEPGKAEAGYLKVFTQGFARDYPLTIRHPSGRKMDVLYNATVYRDKTGNIQGVFAAARDITERKQVENELVLQRDNFRKILNAITDGIYVVNRNYDIEYVNPVIEHEFGKADGRKCHAYFHDRSAPCPWCKNDEVFKGNTVRWEWYSSKTGKTYDLVDTPIINSEGSVSKFEMFHDTTERKRAEAALAQERQFLDVLLNNIAEAVVSCDDQGIITRFNHAARELHGLPEQPISPEQWAEYYDLYQADGKTPLRREEIPLFRALQGERVRDAEMAVIPKGRATHFLLASGQSMRDTGGKLLGAVVTMHDITERKKAEIDLLVSEANLRALLDNFPYLAWLKDTEGRYITVNKVFADFLHLENTRQAIGKTDLDLQPNKELAEKYRADDAGVLASGQQKHVEEPSFDGENMRWVETYKTPIIDKDGILLGTAGCASDITERKQVEEKIRQMNVELEQRVAERTAELESFSYSVSHDLRVPLRAVDGFSRMVLNQYADKLDDEGKRLLNVVRDNTKKMGQLIDDILAFSRAGRMEIKAAQVDMESLAGAALDGLQQATAGRDLTVEIKPLPPARGDFSMLQQVWINLLANAIKFTGTKSPAHIEVGGSSEGTELVYYVKDNGAGFDQQYAHKLFGVFQRLHGVAEFEGTGIGLAIVKRVIARHGGRVWAEGKVDEGATVYFTLPVL
jgi:PAS domain S-box-containing protein